MGALPIGLSDVKSIANSAVGHSLHQFHWRHQGGNRLGYQGGNRLGSQFVGQIPGRFAKVPVYRVS